MRINGDIYHTYNDSMRGDVIVGPTRVQRFFYHLMRGIGAGMIGFAVILFVFAFGPVVREEILYKLGERGIDYRANKFENLVDKAEADKTIAVQQEAENFGINPAFSIVIPKINAASNIIANVDASESQAYLDALQKGVAHAKGTYFPGQGRNIYLFSHSTDVEYNVERYNAVFYLLRKLERGDKIVVFFADEKYEYEVYETVVTSAKDTTWLVEKSEEEVLVLQTCDPPGTNWKRLLVLAKPV